MIGGFFPMDCRVKSPRAWRCRRRARVCWENPGEGVLNQTNHKQILKGRNTKTSKLQLKNWQDRVYRVEVAESSLEIGPQNFSRKIHPVTGVCVLLRFIDRIFGNHYNPGVIPLQGTWGGWIFTLHLNYVAGYTRPLLYLFERTHNYYVDNQGLVP